MTRILIDYVLFLCIITKDDGKIQTGQDNTVDIVSEWQEEINEKKIDKLDETRLSELAWEHAESMDIACRYEEAAVEGYKAGYRKALEQHKLDIEKACDWFSEHIIDYVCYNEMDGWDVYHGEMHKDFRKAMEGKE